MIKSKLIVLGFSVVLFSSISEADCIDIANALTEAGVCSATLYYDGLPREVARASCMVDYWEAQWEYAQNNPSSCAGQNED